MYKAPPQAPKTTKNNKSSRTLLTVWNNVWQGAHLASSNPVQLPPMVAASLGATAKSSAELSQSPTAVFRPLSSSLLKSPHVWLDRIEDLVMQDGWPVPLSRYYLIHHDKLLHLLDQLRASLYESDHGHPHPLVAPPKTPVNGPVYTNQPYKHR
jgi:hypothetical protein